MYKYYDINGCAAVNSYLNALFIITYDNDTALDNIHLHLNARLITKAVKLKVNYLNNQNN